MTTKITRDAQINIRVPAELKEKMIKIAKRNDRNLTRELVSCISERIEREEFFSSIPEMTHIKPPK